MIKINHNIKAVLFALILTLGTYLILYIRPETSLIYYIVALAVNYIIFFFELTAIRISSKARLVQYGLPVVKRYSVKEEAVLHQLLPIVLFSSFNIFVFFNSVDLINTAILGFVFFSFIVLFINIRAYHEDKFKLEQATHFVYPFASIFGLFSLLNAFLNIANINSLEPAFIICGVIILLMISSYTLFIEILDWNIWLIIYLVLSNLIITGITFFLYHNYDSILRTSFMASTGFYFSAALIHHKRDSSLDRYTIYEYVIIFILAYVLLYGIA